MAVGINIFQTENPKRRRSPYKSLHSIAKRTTACKTIKNIRFLLLVKLIFIFIHSLNQYERIRNCCFQNELYYINATTVFVSETTFIVFANIERDVESDRILKDYIIFIPVVEKYF